MYSMKKHFLILIIASLFTYGCTTTDVEQNNSTANTTKEGESQNILRSLGALIAVNNFAENCRYLDNPAIEKLDKAEIFKENWLKENRPDLVLNEEETIHLFKKHIVQEGKFHYSTVEEVPDDFAKKLKDIVYTSTKDRYKEKILTNEKSPRFCNDPELFLGAMFEGLNKEIPVNSLK